MIQYSTIDRVYGPEEIKIKGSRFISSLYPVSRVSDVSGILVEMRKVYRDASHICFAYRLVEGGKTIFRFYDDGEPSGTAGQPIYAEIKGRDYHNILLVVGRYFGGIKLGTGGLARAYGHSARKVLQNSKKIVEYIRKKASIFFPYGFTGEIRSILDQFSVEIIRQDFSEKGVEMELRIPLAYLDDVARGLLDKCRGMVKLDMDFADKRE